VAAQHLSLAQVVSRELADPNTLSPADASILDELAGHGFSEAELFDLIVPRRTLARRRQEGGKLSAEESDRAVRVARLTAMAERVFGEDEKAHRWLRKPSRTLAGAVPLALMKSERGAHLVEEALHRIDYGMLA
jgi:putative toxin-antitoxin system antitoxin component (TIGR02293 family)